MLPQPIAAAHIFAGMLEGMAQMGATYVKTDETHVYFDVAIGSEIDNYEQLKIATDAFMQVKGLRIKVNRVPAAPLTATS